MTLGRLSLIGHAVASAREAKRLSRCIVSTDDAEIAEEARRCGGEVPFLRPAALASDEAGMIPVLQHAVHWAEGIGERPDLIVLLQPTSPFRTGGDIDATIEKVLETGSDSAQTLMDASYHPFFMLPWRATARCRSSPTRSSSTCAARIRRVPISPRGRST
jgi:CMP-N-acetylneuraminic acid synthetase